MKKLLLLLLCLMTVVASGCGDKFSKEKEAMEKAEKAALAVEVPVVVKPEYSKYPKTFQEEFKKYMDNLKRLIDVEEKVVAETRKSDAQIDELLKKAENDSEKKSLQEFRDKLHKERLVFVKKVSKGRLYGDTFIVGVGSTWQEVEMVYGRPKGNSREHGGFREYIYDGIVFRDWIDGGAYMPNDPRLINWRSTEVQAVNVKGKGFTSDAGVKMGMSRDEVLKVLRAKYVKKSQNQKQELDLSKGEAPNSTDYFDTVTWYSMQDTAPYHIYLGYKNGKLANYAVAPH